MSRRRQQAPERRFVIGPGLLVDTHENIAASAASEVQENRIAAMRGRVAEQSVVRFSDRRLADQCIAIIARHSVCLRDGPAQHIAPVTRASESQLSCAHMARTLERAKSSMTAIVSFVDAVSHPARDVRQCFDMRRASS